MGGASEYFSGSKRPDRWHMNLSPCPYMRSASLMSLSGFILGSGRHGDGSMLPYISIAPSRLHPSQKPSFLRGVSRGAEFLIFAPSRAGHSTGQSQKATPTS